MLALLLMSNALLAHQLVMAETLGVPIVIADEPNLLLRQSGGQIAEVIEAIKPKPARGLLTACRSERLRRSRGPQAPATRKANRAHVSRRTRRKHRRAAMR